MLPILFNGNVIEIIYQEQKDYEVAEWSQLVIDRLGGFKREGDYQKIVGSGKMLGER